MKDVNELLNKKWFGGLYHIYSTNDTWEQWIDEFESSYQWSDHDAEKIIKVLGNNLLYIKDKNVIDLACNLGYFTLASSNIGAKNVTGVEVRQLYIDVFDKVKTHWPHNNVTVVNANLEKIDILNNILIDVDTILYTGHLYHTVNHSFILNAFTKSSATCIIVESIIPKSTTEFKESVTDPLNGYIDESTLMVNARAPSIAETKNMISSLGWTVVSEDIINSFNPKRFVITATRNTGEQT
jgi:predicted rRNA methylase YqxC with S4 and FtsJ domains